MTLQEQYIERLRGMVEAKFGRSITTAEDCRALADVVAEEVDMHLDAKDYASLFIPMSGMATRPVTLSALTRYVGYDSWSDFCSSGSVTPAEDRDKIPTPRYWGVAILTALAIVVVVITALLLLREEEDYIPTTDAVIGVVESVERRWHARTLEECNTVRIYADSVDYQERVTAFIDSYCAALHDDVSRALRLCAEEQHITLSVEDIALHAERISASCRAMCEALVAESEIISRVKSL